MELQYVMLLNYLMSMMEAVICSVWIFEIFYMIQDSIVMRLTRESILHAYHIQKYLNIIIAIMVIIASYIMHVFFGHALQDYHSIPYSLVTTCLSFTEKFDYYEHREVNMYMAMVYTSYYFIFCRILFVNIEMAVNIDSFNVIYERLAQEIGENDNLTNEEMNIFLNEKDEIVLLSQCIARDIFNLLAFPFKVALCYYPYKVFQQGVLVKLQKKRAETQMKADIKAKEFKA